MSSPETAGAARPSLAQDWLYALRYWLRGPKGIAVLVVSALVVGAALNWSWLVAVGNGHGPQRPNEQWRDRSPQQPDRPR